MGQLIPNVNMSVNAGGVGIIVPGVGPLPVNVAGWCSQGPAATPTAIGVGAVPLLTATFGVGSAVELAAQILAQGAPAGVIVTRIYDGSIASPFTRTGTGPASAVTASGSPMAPYGNATATGSTGPIVFIFLGGTIGTAEFTLSLDGGNTFTAPQLIPSGPYVVPNTGLTLSFAAGTYVIGDTYIGAITTSKGASYTLVSNVNTLMVAGSTLVQQVPVPGMTAQGEGAITMDTTNNPQDAYQVIILITGSGVLGVGTFEYSIDGGLTFNGNTQIPSGGGPTTLGSTGINVDWTNTGGSGATPGFIAGETYVFTTIPPSITNTDILNVGEAITGSPLQWDWMHVVGRPSSISAGVSISSTLDTISAFWFSNARYSFAVQDQVICTSTQNVEAALVSAYEAFASNYVSVGAGDCNSVSAITGAETSRCASWAASIWGSKLQIGTDLAEEALGNLPFVVELAIDQNIDPTLTENRFTSLRTIPTATGFYVANAFIMSGTQSDITYWQSRRVLNQACRIAYAALVTYLSKPVLVSSATGTIAPKAATAIQNFVLRELNAGLQGQVSGVSCIVNTTNDVLLTETMEVTVGVVPLFYPKYIDAVIGYVNPALSTQ